MTKHTLTVRKPFKIMNRKKELIRLPVGYCITGYSKPYTENLVEKTDFICDEDDCLIEEMTEIKGLEWSFVHYPTEDDPT